jgi:hypothetical protein
MVDDDADSEGLVRSLLAGRDRLLASIEQDQTGRLATGRLDCPAGDGNVVVDLLFARRQGRGKGGLLRTSER